LNAEERRQLQDLVQRSGEMRLLSVMLSEFERESQMRPGDDVLLARIGERALGLTTKAPARSLRRGRLTILLAAALTLLGSAAWAWRTVFEASRADGAPKHLPSASAPRSAAHATRGATVRPSQRDEPKAAVPLDEPITVIPLDEPIPTVSLAEPLPEPRDSALVPERRPPHGVATSSALDAPSKLSFNPASELFARANSLRRQGRTSEAAALYELVLDDHPGSREAPPARLALAKILRAKAPARALAHFRALARQGGALRPEALWGMAEAARTLGNDSVEARALSDLLREFPDSPYADAARSRALHDAP
jgi:hypothetical protein